MTKLESLKKNSHFQRVLRNRVINNECFTIYRSKNFLDKKNKGKKLYVSFVMRKKIGNAVKRNKAKRIMRELARKILINGKINSYYVLIAKTSLLEEKFEKLLLELKEKAND